MSSTPRSAYRPDPDATPEQARNARARVWRYVFECYAKRKAAPPSGPDDTERRSNEVGAFYGRIIHN